MQTVHVSAAPPKLRLIATSLALVFSLVACQPQSRAATEMPDARSPTSEARPAPPSTSAPTSIVISVGEETTIAPDTRLRLLRVVADSRCPKGVQCVWAGEVTLEFELGARDGKKRFELSGSHSPRAAVGSRQFELKDYQACPAGSGRMADAECATVAITAAALR